MARRKYSRKQNKKTFKSKRKTIRKTKTNKKTNKKTKKGGSFDETPSQTEKMKSLSMDSRADRDKKRAYLAFWKNYFCYKMETYIEFPLKKRTDIVEHIEFPLNEEETTDNIKAIAEHYTTITTNMKEMEKNEEEIIGRMKKKAFNVLRKKYEHFTYDSHFTYDYIIKLNEDKNRAKQFATGAVDILVYKGEGVGIPNTKVTYDEKYTEEIINQKFKELREKNKDLIEENDKLYKEKILPVIKAYDKVIITNEKELEKFRKGEYPTPVQLSKLQTDSERDIISALFKDIQLIPNFLPFANWCNISIEEMKKLKGRDEEFTFHLDKDKDPNKIYK